MLKAGDRVPSFTLSSDSAGEISSAQLTGQRYVLYFYPKDDTSGCTVEACQFRDQHPEFQKLRVPVYGVSPDSVASHEKFTAKFTLNFPLLADEGHTLADAFGVWVEKSMYGRKYMGVQRSTFVIGPDGKIEHAWEKVTPDGHAAAVLAALGAPASAATPAPAKPAKKAAAKKAAAATPAVKKVAQKKAVKKAKKG